MTLSTAAITTRHHPPPELFPLLLPPTLLLLPFIPTLAPLCLTADTAAATKMTPCNML
jgi:hypothetical protein